MNIILNKQKKRPEFSQKELDDLVARANALFKHDPYNAPVLKVLVWWDISRNKKTTLEAFEEGIRKTPHNINIYLEYWKFLKYLKRNDKMIELSERIIKAADNPAVPTDQWIEAHDIRFKSLLMKGNSKEIIEEAVNTLKKIWYILPPLPIDGLWYIQDAQMEAEIEKDNQAEPVIIKDDKLDTQETLDSKLKPVTSPTKAKSFHKSSTMSAGFFLSLKDGKSHLPKSKEAILNSIRKQLKSSSKDSSLNSKEAGIKGIKSKKKEEDKNSENDDHSSVSSNYNDYDNFLRVTFKSDFLYKIGKVWAKSGFMLERALKYLNDFLLIINFYKQDMETQAYHKLRAHAIYYIGIAYFQLGDKELAEKMLREIQIELIESQGKDSKKVRKIDSILSTYFTERFNTLEHCITDYFN